MKSRYLIALLLALALLAAWFFWPRGIAVDVVAVTSGPLTQSVVATGRIATPSRIELGSQLTAIVDAVAVREGAQVKAGDVLVRLRASDADAAVEQARTQMQEARAGVLQLDAVTLPVAEQSVRQAQANLRVADAEYERARQLVAQQFFSPSKLDEAARQLENARASLRAAQAQLDASRPSGAGRLSVQARLAQSQAALASAQARRDLLTLRAPVDAVVLGRGAEPGDVAQAGRALLTLAETGETRIYATLDEKNLRYLRVDAGAQAVADAFPGQPFAAQVYYIAPAIDAERGTVEVRLRVPDPPGFLRPDMTVSVEVLIGQRQRALTLPLEAVRDVDTAAPWVLVARDGRAERVAVKTGLHGVGLLEITEGLAEGDSVIMPAGGALEGDAIRIKPARGRAGALAGFGR
ncbi:MAG: efflux RND transporter periplasmic adaptor subunit [Gammaproteobacteria bacterium]|jgi:HlyD family secretion protein|nr:efflux RND transporter periplasmic adaptor subunit [Gammaproteobacteria bacterium]MBU0771288.1 efflux RND transporter periplasmic adaptor subunit [Gammaproteobacteria bacterium]MBU0858103.1 efflux RND transporter periplasmic adaptor subunit [Gammaproteobacteria bacterium]MBU1847146.1 efflux RND transporter periplasmic adaptor subunit [Gammaproteobacteria bacterium]